MKSVLLTALVVCSASQSFASRYLSLSGKEALQNQSINQYDDTENPPQAYKVQLPAGYSLIAVDVNSNGFSVCGIANYDSKKQSFTVEGFQLETDAGGCTVTLTVFEKATKKEIKVDYSIEQTGT